MPRRTDGGQGSAESVRASGAVNRFLDVVERVGNALPDPTTLFALLAPGVVVLSGIAAQFDLSVSHPTTGKLIEPVSPLSVEGLHHILTGLVTNFTSFAPRGTVLVAMIGIGTLVSPMLPCSLTFLAGWSALFIAWLLLGRPVGPGAPTSLGVGGATPWRREISRPRPPRAASPTARRRVHAQW